jgi:hypothetical protein
VLDDLPDRPVAVFCVKLAVVQTGYCVPQVHRCRFNLVDEDGAADVAIVGFGSEFSNRKLWGFHQQVILYAGIRIRIAAHGAAILRCCSEVKVDLYLEMFAGT